MKSAKAQHQMQSGLFLDVVIRKSTTVLQLFACEDQPLLVRWNAFLVLYFCLHVVNRVAGLDIEGDRLARKSLHEDLNTTTKAQYQMQRGLLLDVVIRKGMTVLQLFACEDQPLLVWWDAFLVLYFCLHVVNRVAGLDIEGDRLACKSLHEDLHTTTKAQYQMQRGLFLDVVIRKSTTVLQLFTCEDQPLLVRWNAFLVLYFCLHVVNRVAGPH